MIIVVEVRKLIEEEKVDFFSGLESQNNWRRGIQTRYLLKSVNSRVKVRIRSFRMKNNFIPKLR